MSFYKLILKATITSIVMLSLNACQNHKPEYISDSYVGVNFTDTAITDFYINDHKVDFGSSPYGGGTGGLCCIKLPKIWTPESTVRIKWTNAEAIKGYGGETVWKEKVVPLPQYRAEKYSTLYVVFLQDDNIYLDMSGNQWTIDKFKPTKPKGWQEPTNYQRYCESVKLTNETPRQCFERLIQRDKENQDSKFEYPDYKWVNNLKEN